MIGLSDMVSKGRKGSKYFQPREDGAGWVLKSRIALVSGSSRPEIRSCLLDWIADNAVAAR